MLFVFLLDTSASMYQRSENGLTLLDCAKGAIEHFHKLRLRDSSARMDRYMLVTCADGSNVIKVLDKFPFANFTQTLKGIQARDLTEMPASIQSVFNFLHLQHLAADMDRFGQGRNPCSIDPTIFLILTDGTEFTSLSSGVLPCSLQTLLLNEKVQVGGDLVMQRLRWDQRIFSIVLRMPSTTRIMVEKSGNLCQSASIPGSELPLDNTISAVCEAAGGKCFVATSWKVLLQQVEWVASRLVQSVVVSFELMQVPGSVNLPPQVYADCQRKIVLVRGGQMQGHWPIPESYLPDPSHPELEARDSHPLISCTPIDSDSYIPSNFIFDKYEVENSPFLGMPFKGLTGACWQVFIHNSKGPNHGSGDPFGFIRLNHGGTLTLFVLPYNYPVLWQLLKLASKPSGSASAKVSQVPQWRQDFERYCGSIPVYYLAPLRSALKRWGLHGHLVPDGMDNSWITGFVASQLKRVKIQAKADLDVAMSCILTDDHFVGRNASLPSPTLSGRSLPVNVAVSSQNAEISACSSDGHSKNMANVSVFGSPPRVLPSDQAVYSKGWDSSCAWQSVLGMSQISGSGYLNQGQGNGFMNNSTLYQGGSDSRKATVFKNPFSVPMEKLLRQLIQLPVRVASAFDMSRNRGIRKIMKQSMSPLSHLAARVAATEEEEARHSVSIENMGDFNEALLKQQLPRNPFADDLDRNKQLRSMFGNPYRQEKNDGADETWQEGTSRPLPRGKKRKRGPEFVGPIQSNSVTSSEGSVEATPSNEFTLMAKTTPVSQEKGIETVTSSMSVPISRLRTIGRMSAEEQDVKSTLNNLTAGKESSAEIIHGGTAEMDQAQLEHGISVEQEVKATSLEDAALISQSRLASVASTGVKKSQHEVASFIVTVIRLLRHAKPGHTHKLFEMLSLPDFPVDKCNFLEQLIEQAHRYNKGNIAKELLEYQNQLKIQ